MIFHVNMLYNMCVNHCEICSFRKKKKIDINFQHNTPPLTLIYIRTLRHWHQFTSEHSPIDINLHQNTSILSLISINKNKYLPHQHDTMLKQCQHKDCSYLLKLSEMRYLLNYLPVTGRETPTNQLITL